MDHCLVQVVAICDCPAVRVAIGVMPVPASLNNIHTQVPATTVDTTH